MLLLFIIYKYRKKMEYLFSHKWSTKSLMIKWVKVNFFTLLSFQQSFWARTHSISPDTQAPTGHQEHHVISRWPGLKIGQSGKMLINMFNLKFFFFAKSRSTHNKSAIIISIIMKKFGQTIQKKSPQLQKIWCPTQKINYINRLYAADKYGRRYKKSYPTQKNVA